MNGSDIGSGIGEAIRGLWKNWAISVGLLILVNFCGLWIPKTWTPIVAFSCSLILYAIIRINRDNRVPVCDRILYLSMIILLWSGVIMMIINLLVTKSLCGSVFSLTPYNPKLPYINILVIAPVSVALTWLSIYRGRNQFFCRVCRIMYGEAPERGLLGNIFRQEGEYAVWMFFVTSIGLTVCEYIYYAFFYINININTPDKFFFIYAPFLIYCFSLVFLAIRYAGVWAYYSRALRNNSLQTDRTILRFLIFCGDNIFLHIPDSEHNDLYIGEEKVDTPVKITLPYKSRLSDYEAEMCFRNLSGIHPDNTRFLYMSEHFNTDRNIFHFACILDNEDRIKESRCKGKWMSLGDFRLMVFDNAVTPMLCSEIERIYQVTMAWKSYDRHGFRLYDIKNYRPAFRLRDLSSWDVDYNDRNWLFVWNNNEDRAFFRLRRWWRIIMNNTVD